MVYGSKNSCLITLNCELLRARYRKITVRGSGLTCLWWVHVLICRVLQCVIRGNNNLPGQNNNLSDQRGAIMTEESYKLAKAERTETAKRVKALSGKVNRYLANEIILPEDVSYSTLLLEMDELWAKFQVDHAELSVILTAMEAYQVGSSVRYQTVNQKNMVEYFTDVNNSTKERDG